MTSEIPLLELNDRIQMTSELLAKLRHAAANIDADTRDSVLEKMDALNLLERTLHRRFDEARSLDPGESGGRAENAEELWIDLETRVQQLRDEINDP